VSETNSKTHWSVSQLLNRPNKKQASGNEASDWAEVLLYIVAEDIYVVPREQMPHETSLSLDSTRIYDYRNSWCVLDGVDPTSWHQMREYRKRLEREGSVK
jgi:hypothetical protein